MTAGCARCGTCCENIWCYAFGDAVKWTTAALESVPEPSDDKGWAYWLEHGWADGDREQAVSLYDPDGERRVNADFMAAHWHALGDDQYRCDAFDPETRLCTAHERRPPVCRDYPWYGGEPSPERGAHMNPQCSYLADLSPDKRPEGARPLIPLAVVTR